MTELAPGEVKHTREEYAQMRQAIHDLDPKKVMSFPTSLLHASFNFECSAPGCGCVTSSNTMTTLFNGPQNGGFSGMRNTEEDDQEWQKRLNLVKELFKAGWLNDQVVTDQDLVDLVRHNCGWTHNDELLEVCIKFLDKNRWKNIIDEETKMNMIHQIAWNPKSQEQRLYWIKRFIRLGCDPIAPDIDGQTIFYSSACDTDCEVMTLLLDKYKANVNEQCRSSREESKSEDDEYGKDRMNALLKILSRYAQQKDQKELIQIKDAIKILLDHKIDLGYTIPELKEIKRNDKWDRVQGRIGSGCNAYDFVVHFGWTEFLADILPIPAGYKPKAVYEYGSWRGKQGDRWDYKHEIYHGHYSVNQTRTFAEKYAVEIDVLQKTLDEVHQYRFAKDQAVIRKVAKRILATFNAFTYDFMQQVAKDLDSRDSGLCGYQYTDAISKYFERLEKATKKKWANV